MERRSAGLLIYRKKNGAIEVLLVHPGGPFWINKDRNAWSIPKGEFATGEDPLKAAIRETKEETGLAVDGSFVELAPVRQKSGKMVFAWAVEGDFDVSRITSNTCVVEWPPRSAKQVEIPEVDKAEYFTLDEAAEKINKGQVPLLRELKEILKEQV